MEITLDQITEWAIDNGFEYVGGQGDLYIGSDGEEMYEDEMIEIIEEDKKATEETYKFLYWWAR
jgi:hypothetical protein